MLRVAITQRVEVVPAIQERRDALDQAWSSQLETLLKRNVSLFPIPGRLDSDDWLDFVSPQLIVLSGGNDIGQAVERDALEARVLHYAARKRMPVLGVCRGMQMLNTYFAGGISKLSGHVAVTHEVRIIDLSSPIQVMTVNSFHNYGIAMSDLSPEFEPLFIHADGSVEAARHRQLGWLGIMWHPERAGNDDYASEWLHNYLKSIV